MFAMTIDWRTFTTIGDETIIERGEIPLHISADDYDSALAEATAVAQRVARGFNETKANFFYRIIH